MINCKQNPIYVEALEFSLKNLDVIIVELKKRNIQYRHYNQQYDQGKVDYHSLFITQASGEFRLVNGMYVVFFPKGEVLCLQKSDYNTRFDTVGSNNDPNKLPGHSTGTWGYYNGRNGD